MTGYDYGVPHEQRIYVLVCPAEDCDFMTSIFALRRRHDPHAEEEMWREHAKECLGLARLVLDAYFARDHKMQYAHVTAIVPGMWR